MADQYAKTRKELMWGLWDRGVTNFNIFKEGPYYACRIGKTIYATHIRQIDRNSIEWWKERIEAKYFYF